MEKRNQTKSHTKRVVSHNKGITLIALIITIVVLLILAAVAISSITNDGILSYAQNAAKDYNQAAKNEQDMLQQYVNYLNNHTGSSNNGGSGEGSGEGSGDDVVTGTGNWTQTGTTVTNGTVTLTVGDTVTNYDESTKEDGTAISGLTNVEWKVLGAENGKILLFSTDDVKASHQLSGKDGYNNGISALNTICADYGNGRFAESARTVTVDDINRVTGYNPAATGDGKPYQDGKINEYLNEVTYTLNSDGKVVYSGANGVSDTSTYTKFEHVDGRTLTADNPITITSNYYYYYPNTLTTSSSGTTNGIATDSAAYLMLFKEATNTSTNTSYWLGSSFVYASAGNAGFGMRNVDGGGVNACGLWDSDGGASHGSYGVRAVVSLKSDVQVTSNGTNSWALSYEA